MKKRKALIFGVTGQDGAYLSKFLLKKNYPLKYYKALFFRNLSMN